MMHNNRKSGGHVARRNGDKELDDLQRFKRENAKLKKENAKLRKLIQRGQINQELLHELVQKETEEAQAVELDKKMLEKWRCHKCGDGVLKLHLLKRLDGTFYYRKCNGLACDHKTRLKRYTNDVEGVKDDDTSD
jgi:hypothetical protein